MPLTRSLPGAVLCLFLLVGCGGLNLSRMFPVPPENTWNTFGGAPERTGIAPTPIRPPLRRAWTEDISAGTGVGSPIVVDSIVVVANLRGEIHAIRATDGKHLGWVRMGEAIQGSPAATGSVLFIPITNTDESVIAYDLASGKTLWKAECGEVEVAPLLLGNRLYIGNAAGKFFCLDPEHGDQLWTYSLPENTRRKGIRSSPAGTDTTVLFGADDGALYALNATTGRLLWRAEGKSSIVAPPLLAHGVAFVGDMSGTFRAFDLATGALRWQHKAGGAIYAGATLADSLLIVGTLDGQLLALRTADGSVKWKTAVGAPVNAAGLTSSGYFYAGTLGKTFVALRIADGTVVWKEEVGGRIKTSPAVAGRWVVVTTDDREILAFEGEGK